MTSDTTWAAVTTACASARTGACIIGDLRVVDSGESVPVRRVQGKMGMMGRWSGLCSGSAFGDSSQGVWHWFEDWYEDYNGKRYWALQKTCCCRGIGVLGFGVGAFAPQNLGQGIMYTRSKEGVVKPEHGIGLLL